MKTSTVKIVTVNRNGLVFNSITAIPFANKSDLPKNAQFSFYADSVCGKFIYSRFTEIKNKKVVAYILQEPSGYIL
jgi:hypothetical protein